MLLKHLHEGQMLLESSLRGIRLVQEDVCKLRIQAFENVCAKGLIVPGVKEQQVPKTFYDWRTDKGTSKVELLSVLRLSHFLFQFDNTKEEEFLKFKTHHSCHCNIDTISEVISVLSCESLYYCENRIFIQVEVKKSDGFPKLALPFFSFYGLV